MPVATGGMTIFQAEQGQNYATEIRQILDYLDELFQINAGPLGITYIGYNDEDLLLEYPAIDVGGGNKIRDLNKTRRFRLAFSGDIFIYHGDASLNHKQRSQADLDLSTAVQRLFLDDMSMGGRVISSWIQSENPGVVRRPKGDFVIGTRLVWVATSEEIF